MLCQLWLNSSTLNADFQMLLWVLEAWLDRQLCVSFSMRFSVVFNRQINTRFNRLQKCLQDWRIIATERTAVRVRVRKKALRETAIERSAVRTIMRKKAALKTVIEGTASRVVMRGADHAIHAAEGAEKARAVSEHLHRHSVNCNGDSTCSCICSWMRASGTARYQTSWTRWELSNIWKTFCCCFI